MTCGWAGAETFYSAYPGVNWTRLYGGTANYAREEGTDVDDFQLVAGIKAWF